MTKEKEFVEIPLQETEQPEIKEVDGLDKDFADFEKSIAEFKPEKEKGVDGVAIEKTIDDNGKFKVKMFLGMACALLSGFHTFLFNMFMGKGVSHEDMQLNDIERAQIEKYLQTPEFIAWLEKINPLWWAVLHIEYMMYQKYAHAVKLMKIRKENGDEEIEEEEKPKKKIKK